MKKVVRFVKEHALSLVFLVCALSVMVAIFLFSAQQAAESNKSSGGVLTFIASLFDRDFTSLPIETQIEILAPYVFIIRKAAHFSIFAALGFFSFLSLKTFYFEMKKSVSRLSIILNALFCLLYAVSDEVHQIFVEGRDCSFRDVCIDFSGSLFGFLMVLLVWLIFTKIKQKSTKSN